MFTLSNKETATVAGALGYQDGKANIQILSPDHTKAGIYTPDGGMLILTHSEITYQDINNVTSVVTSENFGAFGILDMWSATTGGATIYGVLFA